MEENKLLNEKDGGRYSLKGSCLWGILLFFILLLVDQVTKIAADVYFNLDGAPDKIVIVPNMIELCMSYNRGIAFSALADAGTTVKMLVVVGTGVVMLAIGALYFKLDKRRTLLRLAIVFIVAGGVGNLIDRVSLGYVVDFLYLLSGVGPDHGGAYSRRRAGYGAREDRVRFRRLQFRGLLYYGRRGNARTRAVVLR